MRERNLKKNIFTSAGRIALTGWYVGQKPIVNTETDILIFPGISRPCIY